MNNTFNYDYFLKDHLGNVRMVLTEEQQTDLYPAASMETATAATEETYYSNLPATRVAVPSGYPANTPAGNARVSKVSGIAGGMKIGPSITLKVMSGDKFNVTVNSWWASASAPQTPVSATTDIVNALIAGIPGLSGGKVTGADLTSSGVLTPGVTSFLTSRAYTTTKPKAYLNWVLFDEQFNFVSSSSSCEQVGASGVYSTHTRTNLTISKSGFLYIYVSNETPNIDVFFDNLQVTHVRGPLLEETHYYPFGLTMASICSCAINFGRPNNNIQLTSKEFQKNEFSDGIGLDLYDFRARFYNPQIGRFCSSDPYSDKYSSATLYNYCFNSPNKIIDPSGKNGVVTGSGTANDPYVIKANYYHYNLTSTQETSLENAANEYNHGGNNGVFQTTDNNGNTVYIKFDLKVVKVASESEAKRMAASDRITDSKQYVRTYGNVIHGSGYSSISNPDAFAGTNSTTLRLNTNSINKWVTGFQDAGKPFVKANESDLLKGVFVHEIGHNLSGLHGDDNQTMINVTADSQGTITYPSLSNTFVDRLYKNFDQGINTNYLRDQDYQDAYRNWMSKVMQPSIYTDPNIKNPNDHIKDYGLKGTINKVSN